MKTKIYYLICLLSFIACKPTWKEYSDADIDYDASTNKWFLISDSSVIKENFITNDGLIDDMPFRREITVDENGHVQKVRHYINSELILEGDFKKAPLEIIRTIYPSHPKYGDPDLGLYYMYTKKTATGSTVYVKDRLKTTISELIYDKDGNLVKEYEWAKGERVIPMSDLFAVEDFQSGLISMSNVYFQSGAIFKLRNKTGRTITDNIRVYYKLIKGDEILVNDYIYVTSDAGWDNNMTQSVVIKASKKLYNRNELPKLNNKPTGETLIITFQDGSKLYEGPIISKIIAGT